jgi:osmotically-inducible protein OsmY
MKDQALKSRVETELEWNPSVDATRVGVAVNKAVVTLSGVVGSYAEKTAIERAALNIRGVHGLAEGVTVRPFGETGIADDEIAERALLSLEWDVMVPDDRVQVRVENGLVSLSGELDWHFQRDAAERAIRNLYGVVALNNHITLKTRVQAADIHKRIGDALDRQSNIDGGAIHLTIDGGTVRLEGQVKAWADRRIVERAAWSAAGVTSVEDRITVAA